MPHGGASKGPACFPAHHQGIWSDIPNGRGPRHDEGRGAVRVVDAASGYANGHTIDREGRLIRCEHGGRRVVRREHDGSLTCWPSATRAGARNAPRHCHAPYGRLLGRIRVPERVSNLVFGGPKRNRLFICASSSLYAVLLAVSGVKSF